MLHQIWHCCFVQGLEGRVSKPVETAKQGIFTSNIQTFMVKFLKIQDKYDGKYGWVQCEGCLKTAVTGWVMKVDYFGKIHHIDVIYRFKMWWQQPQHHIFKSNPFKVAASIDPDVFSVSDQCIFDIFLATLSFKMGANSFYLTLQHRSLRPPDTSYTCYTGSHTNQCMINQTAYISR